MKALSRLYTYPQQSVNECTYHYVNECTHHYVHAYLYLYAREYINISE